MLHHFNVLCPNLQHLCVFLPLLSVKFVFKTLDTFVPTYCDVDLEVMKIAIMCLFDTIENRTGEILPPSQSEHVAGNYRFPGTACSSLLLGEINRYRYGNDSITGQCLHIFRNIAATNVGFELDFKGIPCWITAVQMDDVGLSHGFSKGSRQAGRKVKRTRIETANATVKSLYGHKAIPCCCTKS